MKLPRLTSIRQRLMLISGAISLLTLLVAGSAFVVNDVYMLRGQMVRDLEVLSAVIGDNCLSALVFDAPETAEKNLATLRREYQIRYAVLYDADGRPFAEYRRDAEQAPVVAMSEGEGVYLGPSLLEPWTLEVVRLLRLDGQPVGRIFIHARMDELAAQLWRYAGMVGLLFLVALTVALVLALRLQRRVSDPILHLAAKTREVSGRGDYSVRVSEPVSDDEVAALFRGFNGMLEQIERRERDLTHIRAHLEQLVEERTRTLDGLLREQRLILEALPLGVIHLMGRRVVRVNPRVLELFGWVEEEMLGFSTERFYPSREEFEEVGRVAYAQMARGGVYRVDRILQRKDGSRFWCRLIGQYIDAGDVGMGSIWIVDDIDRDKALEERLRWAREAAEAASRAKDAFVANMSHELRTPLNSVLGFAQLLEGDLRLDDTQRSYLKGIRRGGERLLGLINEVLDLAKIEAGQFEPEPSEWDTRELLQELDGMFRARAERRGIDLRIESPPGLPLRLRCDARRVHQISVNLLDNAVKYTKEGSVMLRADFVDGSLALEVADTGVGISAGELESVFEPFKQAGDTNERPQGTGLGLAITKRLVERMGGTISVDSVPGEGSTFRVRIPADAVSSPGRAGGRGPSNTPATGYLRKKGLGPLRILVVDDEASNRKILRGLLEPLGFQVEEADNGRECIETAEAMPPDLVLMDLRMPGMDGLEATRALRRRPSLRTVPVVAVTAAAFEEDRAAALAAGCDDHLAKPVLRDGLVDTLGTLLPLEWVRGESPPTDQPDGHEEIPPEQAQRLAKMVRTGSISAIKELGEKLVRSGCCPVLAGRIVTLAEDFDAAGLRRLAAELGIDGGVDGTNRTS